MRRVRRYAALDVELKLIVLAMLAHCHEEDKGSG